MYYIILHSRCGGGSAGICYDILWVSLRVKAIVESLYDRLLFRVD